MATHEELPNTCDTGYKCKFKDGNIQESFKCSSCKRVSRDPHTTCCGLQFCGDYLRQLRENEENCPGCGDKYQFIPSKKIHKQIMELEAFCTMKDQGCNWEGVVKDLGEHEDLCEYTHVPCPQNCGQDQITRRSLDTHMNEECPKREYTCPHCNFKDTYAFVTNAHLTECSYKPVACPNHCGVEGERDDMDAHIQNECPLEYIACKLGCSTRYRREDEKRHAKDCVQQHLTYLADAALQMNDTIKDLTSKIERQQEQFEFTTQRRHEETEELKTQLEQERSRVELLEKQVSNMTNNVQQDERLGEDISPPEHSGDSERREIRELERKSDEKDRELERLRTKLEEHEGESSKQIEHLTSRIEKLEKLLNNSSSRVPAVPHALAAIPCLQDGQDEPLAFTLKSYSKLKEAAEEWCSPPFSTFENGPKLRVSVWPNGQREGNGTHVSVWLVQEFNSQDTEPFLITLTLLLIGGQDHSPIPNDVTKSFIITSNERYVGEFENKFIPHSDIAHYLKNDSLEFRITYKHVENSPRR